MVYELQMYTEFTMYEVTSGATVSTNVFHNGIMLFHGMDHRSATVTFVVLAFEERGYCAGRLSEESTRTTCVLLRYRGSLKNNNNNVL